MPVNSSKSVNILWSYEDTESPRLALAWRTTCHVLGIGFGLGLGPERRVLGLGREGQVLGLEGKALTVFLERLAHTRHPP